MPHASETPRLLPVAMVAESGAGAEAGEATVSCLMVRGPATASTALCAMALPPPNAKPSATAAPIPPPIGDPACIGAGGGAEATGAGAEDFRDVVAAAGREENKDDLPIKG